MQLRSSQISTLIYRENIILKDQSNEWEKERERALKALLLEPKIPTTNFNACQNQSFFVILNIFISDRFVDRLISLKNI